MTEHLFNVKHMQIDIVKRVVIVATSQEVWKYIASNKTYLVQKIYFEPHHAVHSNILNVANQCQDQAPQYCSRIIEWCPGVCDDNCWDPSLTTTQATTTNTHTPGNLKRNDY